MALPPCATAQAPSLLPVSPAPPVASSASSSIVPQTPSALPDAPSVVAQQSVVSAAEQSFRQDGSRPVPRSSAPPVWTVEPDPGIYRRIELHRTRILHPSQQFLNTQIRIPLTSSQKAFIAATDVIDTGNLLTLVGSSAYFVATTPHSAYGPGLKGFGRNVGYSLLQDSTGEFFATYAIPSLVHQDPRYFRMPGQPFGRRVLHALAHTVVSQHDDGSPMPNYALLGTYPIAAVLSNLYVPGLRTNPASTAGRVAIAIASDPADTLINEFLPDVASRLHVRIVFFQQIINTFGSGPTASGSP